MPCSFIHIHSNFVLSPVTFDVANRLTVGCFFLSKKMMIQGHRECSCLWFLIVRIQSTTWGNRHLLFMADGAWVPWTEPMNLMAVQSVWPPGMHFWNIYKTLQLMGSFTYLSTRSGFLSVKSTASHLAIARFSHTSLTNQYRISQMWCQGDQGRSKQWRRSLRLKLKTSWWKSSFVSKKRQLPVSCASLFIESFFSKRERVELFFGLGVCLCGGRWGVWFVTVAMKFGSFEMPVTRIPLRSHLVYFDHGRLG